MIFLTLPSIIDPSFIFFRSSDLCSFNSFSVIAFLETTILPLYLSIFKISSSRGLFNNSLVSFIICLVSIWLPGRKATTPSKSTLIPPLTLLNGIPVTTLFSLKLSCKFCHAFCFTAFSLDNNVSPFALSTFSIKTSIASPTCISEV